MTRARIDASNEADARPLALALYSAAGQESPDVVSLKPMTLGPHRKQLQKYSFCRGQRKMKNRATA